MILKIAKRLGSIGKPPKKIPRHLLREYTMDGKAEIRYSYRNDTIDKPTFWTAGQIDQTIQKIKKRELGAYGKVDHWLYEALEKYPIKSKKIAIIGSADQGCGPWYECMALCFGGIPLTIEYNQIVYENTLLTAITPKLAQEKKLVFDAAISILTFEHDGLGRYGDPIDPNADIKAMHNMKKSVKQKGLLYLAVPLGKDKVIFNLHRIYGRFRLPKLLEGWTMIDSVGYDEALLDRDTEYGWCPKDNKGQCLYPEYPEYSPVLILRNN